MCFSVNFVKFLRSHISIEQLRRLLLCNAYIFGETNNTYKIAEYRKKSCYTRTEYGKIRGYIVGIRIHDYTDTDFVLE